MNNLLMFIPIFRENSQKFVSENSRSAMPVANLADLLKHASENGYAVVTFPVTCMDMLSGTIAAAEENRAPLVLVLEYGRTPSVLAAATAHAASEAKVPVALLCAGVKDTDSALESVRMGCNALSLHGEPDDFTANVRRARELGELLDPAGITLEGTLGSPPEETGAEWLTLPSESKEYTKRTSVHALQVGFGTRGESNRPDFGRLSRLRQSTSLPLSTAVPEAIEPDDFHRLIARGISRVDCSSRMRRAVDGALSKSAPLGGAQSFADAIREATKAEATDLFKHTHSAGRLAEVMLHCRTALSSFNVFTFEVAAELKDEAREVLAEHQERLYAIPGVQQVYLGHDGQANGTVRFTTILRCTTPKAMEKSGAHSACQELTHSMLAFTAGRPGGLMTVGSVVPARTSRPT